MNGNAFYNGNGHNGNGNGHKVSFLSRLFNLSGREWPRVIFCFLISFFPRVGFVAGWTALTAMFVAHYGIAFLPTLFILNAIFIILGSFLYSPLISKIRKEPLMILTVMLASVVLFSATFFPEKNIWFFLTIIAAQAIFLTQLVILTYIFVEDQFSPLESQRAFPFIESAETIGSIVGGLAIGYSLHYLQTQQLLLIWILFAIVIVPLLIAYNYISYTLPLLPKDKTQTHEHTPQKISDFFGEMRKKPFLKGLLVIVMTQWIIFNMLEFQYTKAVEQRITQSQEETLALKELPKNRIFHVALLTDPTGLTTPNEFFHSIPRETLEYEEERKLAAVLGKLHILFGLLALMMHLFLASRFIQYLGVTKSMLFHPILLFGSFIAMFFRFNFITAVMTKANFEVGHALFRNSYHSSFYAFPHGIREQSKEFLEGFARPLGIIIGMGSLVLFHFLWTGKELTLAINIAITLAIILMIRAIMKLRKDYTHLAEENLFNREKESEKWNATEILCQKGHEKPEEILIKAFNHFSKDTRVAVIILRAFSKLRNPKVIPALLDCLADPRFEIRSSALSALENIPFHRNTISHSFSRYRMVESLKDLFQEEDAISERVKIIRLFSKLHERDAVEFILKNLSHENPHVKAHCITACSKFGDPGTAYYLEKYLEDDHPKIQASTAFALFQFPWLREKAEAVIDGLIASNDTEKICAAFELLVEVKDEKYQKVLQRSLYHENENIRFQAALSLSAMNDRYGMEVLVDELLLYTPEKWQKFLREFASFTDNVKRKLKNIISRKFSEKISRLFKTLDQEEWSMLPDATLAHLEAVYELLGLPEEACFISEKRKQAERF